jgi:hypothetical protein
VFIEIEESTILNKGHSRARNNGLGGVVSPRNLTLAGNGHAKTKRRSGIMPDPQGAQESALSNYEKAGSSV